MRTYKHLYPRICTFANLYTAYRDARRGKRDKQQVYEFEFNAESELLRLQTELRAQTYQPSAYTNFRLNDRKRRLVSAAPFRDRVVHHALCNIVEPILERQFIFDSVPAATSPPPLSLEERGMAQPNSNRPAPSGNP